MTTQIADESRPRGARRLPRDPRQLGPSNLNREYNSKIPAYSSSQTYDSLSGRSSSLEPTRKRRHRGPDPAKSTTENDVVPTVPPKSYLPASGNGSFSGLSKDSRARHQERSAKKDKEYRDLDLPLTQKPDELDYGDGPATFALKNLLAGLSMDDRAQLLLEIVRSQGVSNPEEIYAALSRENQDQLFLKHLESRNLQAFGLEKLGKTSDPAVALQILTRSQLKLAAPVRDHAYRPGDILQIRRQELTCNRSVRFGQKNITASDEGLTSNKRRPVLIGTIDHTSGLATGWELGTRDGMGLETVRDKGARQTYYHVMEINNHDYSPVRLKNGKTVALNRTGRPSLLVENVPPGIIWSRLSHMHSLSRVSFRIINSHKFIGRLIPESRVRVFEDEAAAATARARHERSIMEKSQGINATIGIPSVHMVAVSSASGDEWEPNEQVPPTMPIYHAGQMKKKRKRSFDEEDYEASGTVFF